VAVPPFIPKRVKGGILKMVRNTKGYARWVQYAEKFGYISMGRIEDKQKVSSYITKYISKGVAASVHEYGAHLYYCSKGLKTGTVIYRGTQAVTVASGWDFERPDGFCKVKWYDSLDSFTADVRFGFCELAAPHRPDARKHYEHHSLTKGVTACYGSNFLRSFCGNISTTGCLS